jgi:predicted adenine nucleotide alpha hydrolase (AANH) superfamily ATPase
MVPSDRQSDRRVRLALHACCGPCLIEPFDAFVAEGLDTTVVFYNPNIQPAEEYARRRDALAEYASRHGVDVVELPYDPAEWREATQGASTREQRCERCYRLRLGAVARWASANGCDVVSTTLTVSPYQDAGAIAEAGEEAATAAGIGYAPRDFRDRYPSATRRSRDEGLYRQNYCGCLPSRVEAEQQRAERKASRKRMQQAGGSSLRNPGS